MLRLPLIKGEVGKGDFRPHPDPPLNLGEGIYSPQSESTVLSSFLLRNSHASLLR